MSFLTVTAQAAAPDSPKPNILLIVSDDQGYGDVGFQGCRDIPTPNLDRLALDGVQCTSGYVSHPFCSPTRAALMTGRYQQRFGHENNPFYNPSDHREGLPLSEKLLPEFLRAAGYATGWIGKWHLGAAPEFHPLKRGFAETFGFIGGGHQYQNWKPNPANEYLVPIQRNGENVEVTNHLTIEFGHEAAAFVRRHEREPWFLYLAFNAPHGPQQPTAERLAQFAGIADPKRRAYAAQVSLLDDAIGETILAIRDSGQRSRTLVFFLSDNGGPIGTNGNGSVNTPLRGGKGAVYEGGVRVPFVVSWPEELPAGAKYDEPVSSLDVFATALTCAGVPMPTDKTYDSVNLLGFLGGSRFVGPHRQLFWRTSTGALAARMAQNKLIRLPGQDTELYDLAADVAESENLATRMPDRAKVLEAALAAWEKELVPPAFPGAAAVREPPPRKPTPTTHQQQPTRQQPLSLTCTDDWQVEVLSLLPNGVTLSNTLAVPQPTWHVVNAERHDALPVFNPKAGGWGKGARLQALLAQECTTPYLLDPPSLVLRTGPEPDAAALVVGRDYDVDPVWGTIGRLTDGTLKEGQPVFASYRHGLLRLDSIVLTADRRIELRPGEAKPAALAPPPLREGERRLANLWLPGVIAKLEPQNLFPISETAFPETLSGTGVSPVRSENDQGAPQSAGVRPSPGAASSALTNGLEGSRASLTNHPAAPEDGRTPTLAERTLPHTLAKLSAGRPLRVLAWGDSVTDGSYLPGGKAERWQEQFVARLKQRFPQAQIELITEAWGGRNTNSYLAEPPGSEHNYAEKVLARKPDLVVSEFVNDGWLNEEQVETHYRRFLDDFTKLGAEWIIFTPHYVRPDFMGLKQERDIDDDPRPYTTGLRQFAAKHGVALADASRRYGRLWRQGIPYSTLMLNSINHPNAFGMGLFADSLLALFPKSLPAPVPTWEFNRAGDNEGWLANSHLTNVSVADGVLKARAAGSDPILEYQPRLDVRTDPWDVFEVRLKADHDGIAEVFWSNTIEGRYGGFSQEKSTRFPVTGDNAWHTYNVRPFWHPEGRIVRLRFDLYDAASFELDSLRIVKSTDALETKAADFDFRKGSENWRGEGGMILSPTNGALSLTWQDRAALTIAPPVDLNADQLTYASLRLAVDRGRHATLHFASADRPGLQSLSFPIHADGLEHTYNLDLLASPHWRGRIIALALRATDEPGATAQLRWLKVAATPQGGPEPEVISLGVEEFPIRAGHPVTLAAVVGNHGGITVSNLEAEVHLPTGVQLLTNLVTMARTLAPGERETFRWQIQAKEPLEADVSVIISALSRITEATTDETGAGRATLPLPRRGGEGRGEGERTGKTEPSTSNAPLTLALDPSEGERENARAGATSRNLISSPPTLFATTRLNFTEAPKFPRRSYVPEPKPVRGPHEVGVYYFPGWNTASRWQPIQRFPERRPVLGWYREGEPEIADWHIKWAVEHGITFFVYDWYWSRGERQLEHGLHDGYFNARYRSLLKFCLLWANHNAPGSHSPEDCLAVTRYWIANYFQRPEHVTVDGKPLMVIFAPQRLYEDLGSKNVPGVFDSMRAECVRAGLKGLYLVACVADAAQAREAAAAGFDGVTGYTWPHLGVPAGEFRAPFATILEGYRRNWQHILDAAPISLLPPVCGGWDSRPWHGENDFIRYDRTPDLFQQHLRDARQLLEAKPAAARLRNLLIIEAWNEWGEGAYIEPQKEYGFGYLDAIRAALTDEHGKHTDVAPTDLGRPPLEVANAGANQTAWEFNQSDDGWHGLMNVSAVGVTNGVLTFRTVARDPALTSPPLNTRAAEFSKLRFRLRLTASDGKPAPDHGQIYWSTEQMPESGATMASFAAVADGQWHDLELDLAKNPRWRGRITRLRFDPCEEPGWKVELDWMRLAP